MKMQQISLRPNNTRDLHSQSDIRINFIKIGPPTPLLYVSQNRIFAIFGKPPISIFLKIGFFLNCVLYCAISRRYKNWGGFPIWMNFEILVYFDRINSPDKLHFYMHTSMKWFLEMQKKCFILFGKQQDFFWRIFEGLEWRRENVLKLRLIFEVCLSKRAYNDGKFHVLYYFSVVCQRYKTFIRKDKNVT